MSLVGVRPDQLLNHYSQQCGFHIGVLSDDLLTIVLYAAGGLVDSTVMGNASSDGFRLARDSIKRVLACRLVNSKWRALSARPVVASRSWVLPNLTSSNGWHMHSSYEIKCEEDGLVIQLRIQTPRSWFVSFRKV